jgi:S-adenosylmethionine/arginine decarboxylase-like enzyme
MLTPRLYGNNGSISSTLHHTKKHFIYILTIEMRNTRRRKAWGQHLVLDAKLCNPEKIRDADHIKDFANTLIKAIHMKAYGDPQVVMFGEGRVKGYTLIQLIETSNITCHFAEEDNSVYLDLFSCKPFSTQAAKEVFVTYFEPERISVRVLQRGGHGTYSKTRFRNRVGSFHNAKKTNANQSD